MIWLILAAVLCPHPHRNPGVISKWRKTHPCPVTCQTYTRDARGRFHKYRTCGACQVDHICPLAQCGADSPENLQWLTAEENRKKSASPEACK